MDTNNQPIVPQEPHDHHTHKILWAVLGVFSIILIAGAIAWWQTMKETPATTPTPQPQAQTNPTADWFTYTNAKYGFEFKLPADKLIVNPTDDVDYENTFIMTKVGGESQVLNITAINKPNNNEQYCEKDLGTINIGSNAVKKCFDGEPEDRWTAFSESENADFVFHCWFPNVNNEMCSQILSTFKFTDSQSLSSTQVLVSVKAHGGLCVTGEVCESTTTIETDGDFLENGKVTKKLSAFDLSELKTQINAANFTTIKQNKFTGLCPMAYDGQEVVYTFYLSGKTEVIASCEIAIDYNSPPFKLLGSLIYYR